MREIGASGMESESRSQVCSPGEAHPAAEGWVVFRGTQTTNGAEKTVTGAEKRENQTVTAHRSQTISSSVESRKTVEMNSFTSNITSRVRRQASEQLKVLPSDMQ